MEKISLDVKSIVYGYYSQVKDTNFTGKYAGTKTMKARLCLNVMPSKHALSNAAEPISIFWFRRDLRLHDNTGLHKALISGTKILPVCIFDSQILDDLVDRPDRRVQFICNQLAAIDADLQTHGSGLCILYGDPVAVWEEIAQRLPVLQVFTNHDYEPYAIDRDAQVAALLKEKGIDFLTFKDQVIFEKREVAKNDGEPYTVFTPYSRKWLATLRPEDTAERPSQNYRHSFLLKSSQLWPDTRQQSGKISALLAPASAIQSPSATLQFPVYAQNFPPGTLNEAIVKDYGITRDFPGINGTSRMGIHLRFGTVSIREMVKKAQGLSAVYLNELIWREFYMMILANFPQVVGHAFKPAYDKIPWRQSPDDFERWCAGKTGYPLVDAGMRELLATGYMHNRVRMVTASFLTKHLLIDWREGEAWFARHLLDFELSSNNGGWQWAAGTGCDAAPYFRIFNPASQAQKFDKQGAYIRKWVPEFGTPDYPQPMVDHAKARERCLRIYKTALGG